MRRRIWLFTVFRNVQQANVLDSSGVKNSHTTPSRLYEHTYPPSRQPRPKARCFNTHEAVKMRCKNPAAPLVHAITSWVFGGRARQTYDWNRLDFLYLPAPVRMATPAWIRSCGCRTEIQVVAGKGYAGSENPPGLGAQACMDGRNRIMGSSVIGNACCIPQRICAMCVCMNYGYVGYG